MNKELKKEYLLLKGELQVIETNLDKALSDYILKNHKVLLLGLNIPLTDMLRVYNDGEYWDYLAKEYKNRTIHKLGVITDQLAEEETTEED